MHSSGKKYCKSKKNWPFLRQGGFGSALMVKDLGLAQDAATRVQAATPLGSLAHQLYRVMCSDGYGGKDFSSAYQFIKGKK